MYIQIDDPPEYGELQLTISYQIINYNPEQVLRLVQELAYLKWVERHLKE